MLPASAGAVRRRGPAQVVEVLANIEKTMRASRYQHYTVVRQARGEYFFDCSGMAAWVLYRSAPMAQRVLGRPRGGRALARDYYHHIARIGRGKTRGPWYRVPDAASAQPGDVITWVRPPWFRSKSTGHVAFVVSTPSYNHKGVPGYLMRVADASRFRHENDSRSEGETGFGTGVLLLATDEHAQPTGYGWYGSQSRPDWIIPTKIVIGRPLR